MSKIRSKNTQPEKIVARELRRLNIYCTRNDKRIFGKPDFVFRRKKVAVFIDSDFWHGNPQRFRLPKSNTEYWSEKINRNRRRDEEVNEHLGSHGWNVIRIWEYDVKKDLEGSMARLLIVLGRL